jgi:hypothetical protein
MAKDQGWGERMDDVGGLTMKKEKKEEGRIWKLELDWKKHEKQCGGPTREGLKYY